jgi:hypothetical protein
MYEPSGHPTAPGFNLAGHSEPAPTNAPPWMDVGWRLHWVLVLQLMRFAQPGVVKELPGF